MGINSDQPNSREFKINNDIQRGNENNDKSKEMNG